ncbi:hypothetical protein HBH53_264880, partial [Parastagonospora nodorum]
MPGNDLRLLALDFVCATSDGLPDELPHTPSEQRPPEQRADMGGLSSHVGSYHEMWNQAQLAWGPGLLEGKVKCVVSIGTGVPSLKPFKDDMLHI